MRKIRHKVLSILSIAFILLTTFQVHVYGANADVYTIPVQPVNAGGFNKLETASITYSESNSWLQIVIIDKPSAIMSTDDTDYITGTNALEWSASSNQLSNMSLRLNGSNLILQATWTDKSQVPTVYISYSGDNLFARTFLEFPNEANTAGDNTGSIADQSDLDVNGYVRASSYNLLYSDMLTGDFDVDNGIVVTSANFDMTRAVTDRGLLSYRLNSIPQYAQASSDFSFVDKNAKEIIVGINDIKDTYYMLGHKVINTYLVFKCYSADGTYLGVSLSGRNGAKDIALSTSISYDSSIQVAVKEVPELKEGTAYVSIYFTLWSRGTGNSVSANTGKTFVQMPFLLDNDVDSAFYLNYADLSEGVIGGDYIVSNFIDNYVDGTATFGFNNDFTPYYDFYMPNKTENHNNFEAWITLDSREYPNPDLVSFGNGQVSRQLTYTHSSTSNQGDYYLYKYRLKFGVDLYGEQDVVIDTYYAGTVKNSVPVTLTNLEESSKEDYISPYSFDNVEFLRTSESFLSDVHKLIISAKVTGSFPEGYPSDSVGGNLDFKVYLKLESGVEIKHDFIDFGIDGTSDFINLNIDISDFYVPYYNSDGVNTHDVCSIGSLVIKYQLKDGIKIYDEWLLPIDYASLSEISASSNYAHSTYNVGTNESVLDDDEVFNFAYSNSDDSTDSAVTFGDSTNQLDGFEDYVNTIFPNSTTWSQANIDNATDSSDSLEMDATMFYYMAKYIGTWISNNFIIAAFLGFIVYLITK